MTPFRCRLGSTRRQLLRLAYKGPCILSAVESRSEKSALYRAARALVRAGLAERVIVRDLDARGREYDLSALVLTDAGREVYRAWYPQLHNGGAIQWKRHERLVADTAWRWA